MDFFSGICIHHILQSLKKRAHSLSEQHKKQNKTYRIFNLVKTANGYFREFKGWEIWPMRKRAPRIIFEIFLASNIQKWPLRWLGGWCEVAKALVPKSMCRITSPKWPFCSRITFIFQKYPFVSRKAFLFYKNALLFSRKAFFLFTVCFFFKECFFF